MAVDRAGTAAQLAVSARRVYRLSRPQDPCTALEQLLWSGRVASDYRSVFSAAPTQRLTLDAPGEILRARR